MVAGVTISPFAADNGPRVVLISEQLGGPCPLHRYRRQYQLLILQNRSQYIPNIYCNNALVARGLLLSVWGDTLFTAP